MITLQLNVVSPWTVKAGETIQFINVVDHRK